MSKSLTKKDCDTFRKDQSVNPLTQRKIDPTKGTAKKILADCEKNFPVKEIVIKEKKPRKKRSPKPKALSPKSKLLDDIKTKCSNDSDPVSLEDFDSMTSDELKNVVKVGSSAKKHCYTLDSIYGVYEAAFLSKKPAIDPMDPSYKLSDEEIASILKMKKKQDPKFKAPKIQKIKMDPDVKLYVAQTMDLQFFHLFVAKRGRYDSYRDTWVNGTMEFDLGYIPAMLEPENTGSTSYSSATLVFNITDLWDKQKLLTKYTKPYECCTLPLSKPRNYWFTTHRRIDVQKFINLCEKVADLM